jgi:inorganic triphosphatase YgiF
MSDKIPNTWNRVNLGKWAVPMAQLPMVAAGMLATPSLVFDPYDRQFRGQQQRTTYFDTPSLDLLKNRQDSDQYLTLRVRCYEGQDGETYVLSVKTENLKWRQEIEESLADSLITATSDIAPLVIDLIPSEALTRLITLTSGQPLRPVLCIEYRRYAIEDSESRLTLDVGICADNGKHLHCGILEWKSVNEDADLPTNLQAMPLRPIKLSKFLWAMGAS